MRAHGTLALLAFVVAALGCSSKTPPPTSTAAPLLVESVSWQAASGNVGTIAALTEFGDGVAVFSDQGALVVAGGAIASADASDTSWRTAATIPAADGNGTWIVAADGNGVLEHLREQTTLEAVSDRYGLADVKIRSIASLGGAHVAFGYDGGFAFSDGATVTRWSAPDFSNLVGGGDRVAALTTNGVSVFDATSGSFSSYAVQGAVAIAMANDGTLLVATARQVFAERTRGDLAEIYDSPDLDIHAATASGARFWLSIGGELLTLSVSEGLAPKRTTGAQLPPTATLIAGASEAVWSLAGGAAHKFVISSGAPSDEQEWQSTIQPIYAKVCAQCHAPGGPSGYDLSTYATWLAQRAQIEQRVVVVKDMPPSGVTLSDADRATIAAWATAHGQ